MVQIVIFNNLLIGFLISLMQLFQIFGLLSPRKTRRSQRRLNVNLHDISVWFLAEQKRDKPGLVPEAEPASSDLIAR